MTMSSHIGQSIQITEDCLALHPENARSTGSAGRAVVEDGLRCRVGSRGPMRAAGPFGRATSGVLSGKLA